MSKEEKLCMWVNYLIHSVLSWFQIWRHLRVLFLPNLYSKNFRVHKKLFFSSLLLLHSTLSLSAAFYCTLLYFAIIYCLLLFSTCSSLLYSCHYLLPSTVLYPFPSTILCHNLLPSTVLYSLLSTPLCHYILPSTLLFALLFTLLCLYLLRHNCFGASFLVCGGYVINKPTPSSFYLLVTISFFLAYLL